MNPLTDRNRRNLILASLGASALGGVPVAARAQAWPTRPIRLIAPSAPGGPTDVIARTLAERFTRVFNVAVVVENRTGGTGTVALDALAKAAPDGYTLGIGFSGANVIYPLLNSKLPFNAQTDFTAIGQMANVGNVLVVHPSVPARNLAEFVAWVKSRPQSDAPVYGSWGNGSGGHLAGEYLKMLTGIEMQHVPYRSTTALTVDMVGGHMHVGFLDMANAQAQARAGKLRALALTGPARALTLADVPTMLEQGVAFGVGVWYGLFGPAGMPAPLVARLSAELGDALRAPELAERWLAVFGSKPTLATPDEFARTVRADWDVWKSVIVRGKITLD